MNVEFPRPLDEGLDEGIGLCCRETLGSEDACSSYYTKTGREANIPT
jgi:hypothetical protein